MIRATFAALAAVHIATPAAASEIAACLARYARAIPSLHADVDRLDRYRAICENTLAGEHRLQTLAVNQQIYANQIVQNTVMLWMVVTITLAGVVMAGIQLWATYRLTLAGKGALADGGEASFEQNRLVVRSSVVGVVILGLSLAFFTLYVLYVYRIEALPGLANPASLLRDTTAAQEVAQ